MGNTQISGVLLTPFAQTVKKALCAYDSSIPVSIYQLIYWSRSSQENALPLRLLFHLPQNKNEYILPSFKHVFLMCTIHNDPVFFHQPKLHVFIVFFYHSLFISKCICFPEGQL